MFDLVEGLVECALARGAGDAEAYAEQSLSHRVKVFEGAVEELTAARRKGVGLRVFVDGAVGYAYSSDTVRASLDEVVERALAHARIADRDEHAVLPPCDEPLPNLTVHDTRLERASDEQRIELALTVERAALAADRRVKLVEDTILADADSEVFLVNSGGFRGNYRENHCYVFAYALAEQEDTIETGLSFSVGRALEDLAPERCGTEAAERACALLGAATCRSMKATVVLDPFVAASVFAVLSSALTGDAVQKGRSLFAELAGKPVASPGLDLLDDGVHPDGLASAPFDAEGTAARSTPLVSGGVLEGFLHNTYTARKAGARSTGNAVRGSYQGMPGVGPTNLVLGGTTAPRDDLIAGIERGVLVTHAVGVHSGANPITGQFSVGISGLLIESGRLGAPVHEVTLAGEIVPMLKGVVALGDDARWVPSGSVLTPSVAIEGMSVGGS